MSIDDFSQEGRFEIPDDISSLTGPANLVPDNIEILEEIYNNLLQTVAFLEKKDLVPDFVDISFVGPDFYDELSESNDPNVSEFGFRMSEIQDSVGEVRHLLEEMDNQAKLVRVASLADTFAPDDPLRQQWVSALCEIIGMPEELSNLSQDDIKYAQFLNALVEEHRLTKQEQEVYSQLRERFEPTIKALIDEKYGQHDDNADLARTISITVANVAQTNNINETYFRIRIEMICKRMGCTYEVAENMVLGLAGALREAREKLE